MMDNETLEKMQMPETQEICLTRLPLTATDLPSDLRPPCGPNRSEPYPIRQHQACSLTKRASTRGWSWSYLPRWSLKPWPSEVRNHGIPAVRPAALRVMM